jgi:hypothetical protein
VDPEKMKILFAHESTFMLCKKLMVYKLMGSNLFINYSLGGMRLCYSLLGKRATNMMIENSVGELFSGGVTTEDCKVVNNRFKEQNVNNLTGLVVEGLRSVTDAQLDNFLDISMKTIKDLSEDGKVEFNFAFKLTAYVGTELMELMNTAQEKYAEVLQISYDASDESILTEAELRENLAKAGITDYSDEDFEGMVSQIKGPR